MQFFQDTVRDQEYRICDSCNNLQVSEGPGIPLGDACPICETKPKASRRRALKFIIPDGFFAMRKNNGKAAGQYLRREQNLMKSALFPSKKSESEQISPLVRYAYDRDGKLLYVNEGDMRYGGRGSHFDRSSLFQLNHLEVIPIRQLGKRRVRLSLIPEGRRRDIVLQRQVAVLLEGRLVQRS